MPYISVIVPYYNSSLYLFRRCIDSILKQTFSDIELLVIIDGSKKNYNRIREEYEARDERIRFLVQENKGVSAARNLGIENAKGTYIAFVDSDDFVEDVFLRQLLDSIERHDLAICSIAEQHFPVNSAVRDSRTFFSMPAEYCWIQYTNFSVNKLYKASILKENNIRFNEKVKLGEDALFLADYFMHCNTISMSNRMLYHYVPNETSATKSYYRRYWEWEKNVIERQWGLFTQYPLSPREEEYLFYWLFTKIRAVLLYYFNNNMQDADKICDEILKFPLYQKLVNRKFLAGEFFGKKTIYMLSVWRRCGALGIKLTLFARNYSRRPKYQAANQQEK